MSLRRHRRLAATVASAAVAIVGLSACAPSVPSDRRIALDIIDGLPADALTDEARSCMTAYVEALPSDRLATIVRVSKDSAIDETGHVVDPPAELVEFQDALVACREGSVVETTAPGTTATSESTMADVSTTGTSTPAGTMADTTTAPDTTSA